METDRAKKLETNHINIPCHIFLVVRLHEQISSLTIFPCQGKASTPAFPCQGKIVHFTPSTRAIFVKEKLSRKNCQGKIARVNKSYVSSKNIVLRQICNFRPVTDSYPVASYPSCKVHAKRNGSKALSQAIMGRTLALNPDPNPIQRQLHFSY